MAITSSGIGSGLDVDTIVTQLVAADRLPTETRLTRTESRANYTLSALGSFKSVMANLQSASARLLSGSGELDRRSATTANATLLAVSAASSAAPGEYQLEVLSLAKPHKIASGTFASAEQVLGAGSFAIDVGSSRFTVTLTAEATLADLRDAINDAADNAGVSAALIHEDGGTRLVLTARDTGTAHALAVTTDFTSFTGLQAAVDAQIKLDGYTVTRGRNHIDDAIEGVTLDLLKAEPGTAFSVTVEADQAAAKTAITGFVNAYNSMVSLIAAQTQYDPVAKTAGALIGDAAVRAAGQGLRSIVAGQVAAAGTYSSLSQLGIASALDGTLEIDGDKLQAALETDGASVRRLLGGEDGVAGRMDALLQAYLDDGGQIEVKTDNLNAQIESVARQREQLDARMRANEARYRAQFSALDAIVSQYQNTQSYLDRLFAQQASDS